MKTYCLLSLFILLHLASSVAADPLQNAKRVLFLGDSITHSGHYIVYLEAALRQTHPDTEFINLGLPSEGCTGLSEPAHPFPRPNIHERLERALSKVDPEQLGAAPVGLGLRLGLAHLVAGHDGGEVLPAQGLQRPLHQHPDGVGDEHGRDARLAQGAVQAAIPQHHPLPVPSRDQRGILRGDDSVGEFYSVAVTNNHQQADTGTKMIHLGKNTRSTIISKGISAGQSNNSYRGLVRVNKNATGARNFSQCDSLLIGDQCGAHTFPYIEVKNTTANIEHEATTSKIGEDQIFYCNQRGLETQDAVNMIVNGFCKEVFRELPMEFAMEAQKLLDVSLEGSVG